MAAVAVARPRTLLAHGGLPALLGVLRAGGASPTAKEYAAGALQNLVFAQAGGPLGPGWGRRLLLESSCSICTEVSFGGLRCNSQRLTFG